LDMFICTRDIFISICESARFTENFFRELLVDFYVQLTTISWLSVRSVQRASQSAQPRENKISLNIFDFLPSWSDFKLPLAPDSSSVSPDYQTQSRAEERIRLAQELEANNSLARARLTLNKILRLSELKKDIVEQTEEEDEDSEISLTDFFLSWFSETPDEQSAATEEEEILTSGTPEDSPDDDIDGSDYQNNFLFFREEEHLELFYLASFLFLSFLLYHIMKKNLQNSRKRGRILQEIQRMRKETGALEKYQPTVGVLRQISFH